MTAKRFGHPAHPSPAEWSASSDCKTTLTLRRKPAFGAPVSEIGQELGGVQKWCEGRWRWCALANSGDVIGEGDAPTREAAMKCVGAIRSVCGEA